MHGVTQTHIRLIAHNIRSIHNIGSLFRSADGLNIETMYITGYSPYPVQNNDQRLPHIANKTSTAIHKTALGAEHSVTWQHNEDIFEVIRTLKHLGFRLLALEQHPDSVPLHCFKNSNDKLAIIVGNEIDGVNETILALCDAIVEIPMLGTKESLNVSVAGAIAIHWFRFTS